MSPLEADHFCAFLCKNTDLTPMSNYLRQNQIRVPFHSDACHAPISILRQGASSGAEGQLLEKHFGLTNSSHFPLSMGYITLPGDAPFGHVS